MNVVIRPLQAQELTKAEHIFRLAFGTFVGLPDPLQFASDLSYIPHRWHTDPTGAFAAEWEGVLIGSNLATCWGSVGFFGPLSVHPAFWDQGIGQRLIAPVLDRFAESNIQQLGLFTFPSSPKHHGLYQKFGFWPRFLTFVMAKSVQRNSQASQSPQWYSQLNQTQRVECLQAGRVLTDKVHEGLDVSQEVGAVQAQSLGDTVLLWDEAGLVGLAICHYGARTEAGSNTCYVKFGAVQPGPEAGQRFEQLLDACEQLAASQGMTRLIAGVNSAQHDAYNRMLARGFRTEITGVAMHKPNEAGYQRPDRFVLCDWR